MGGVYQLLFSFYSSKIRPPILHFVCVYQTIKRKCERKSWAFWSLMGWEKLKEAQQAGRAKNKDKTRRSSQLILEIRWTVWTLQTRFGYVAHGPTHLQKERVHFTWCPTLRPFVVWVQGTREEEEEERKLYSQKISIRFGQINSNLLVIRPRRRSNILKLVILRLFLQFYAPAEFAASRRSAERLRFCCRLDSMKPAHYAEGAGFVASRSAPTAYALSSLQNKVL